VRNFPDWQAALQFEWKWKNFSRKLTFNMLPLERRIIALKEILKMDRPTSKAKLFSDWETPPEVILETNDANLFYNNIFPCDII
jgi:hypothetical protein